MRQEQRILLNKADIEGFLGGKPLKFDGFGPGGGMLTLAFEDHDGPPAGFDPRARNGNGVFSPSNVVVRVRRKTRGRRIDSPQPGRPGPRLKPGFKCPKCKLSLGGHPTAHYANHIRHEHGGKVR